MGDAPCAVARLTGEPLQVNVPDLAAALTSGQLGGAAVDVFPSEPKASGENVFESELCGCPNTILSPHIGGSTMEAQRAIGLEVAASFKSFINQGATSGAVNFPSMELPMKPSAHRILNFHKNEPGVLSQINNILAEVGANIISQILGTQEDVGYVIIDINKEVSAEVVQRLRDQPFDIKTRVLF